MSEKSEKDVSDTIVAKSDQLNADDLVSGPIQVTITGVKRRSDEQPISVEITGGHRPWLPCKTMRRVLVSAWGKDATQWTGKSVILMRDPDVKWAGEKVGGIRVMAMSHIPKRLELALAASGKAKKLVTIEVLKTDAPKTQQTQAATDLRVPFTAMKDRWKSRREDRGLTPDIDSFSAFVDAATGGLVPAKQSTNVPSYTEELIAKCVASINETMPEQF